MPITFRIDHEARLVRVDIVGDWALDEVLSAITDATAEFKAVHYNVLADHRQIGRIINRGELEQFTDRLSELQKHFAGARWAVVVSNAASYGMMRMFSVMAERIPLLVNVFENYDAAERWVTADDPPGSTPPTSRTPSRRA